jgi:putative endonuclease
MPDMGKDHQYFVYIMTNQSRTLYVGVTGNIRERVYQHKQKLTDGFTKKYNIDRLVYFETFGNVHSAIAREKAIKSWLRAKKIDLIQASNPDWRDLSDGWYACSW